MIIKTKHGVYKIVKVKDGCTEKANICQKERANNDTPAEYAKRKPKTVGNFGK
jgi:hypothetical protein